MKQTTKSANVLKDSKNVATVANVENLETIQIVDNTTTKGKVNAKFNLVDESQLEESTNKVDKNQLFSVELSDYFCPVKFDSSTLETNLQPLVDSGILSVYAMQKAIETAKKEFKEQHSEEIEQAENMNFSQVLAKLQENDTLYKKVLTVCNVSNLVESNYIDANGKVKIYRANQCLDKDGKERYQIATLKKEENGKEFVQPLYVELREQTTTNILLAIRYYSSKQNAAKTLLNKVADYKRILTYVYESVKKAKDNGFSIEQVMQQVTNVFDESSDENK